jgi:hypothetical protein
MDNGRWAPTDSAALNLGSPGLSVIAKITHLFSFIVVAIRRHNSVMMVDTDRLLISIKCQGQPYTTVGGRPWLALGTPKSIICLVLDRDPVEKKGQKFRRGMLHPRILLCLAFDSRSSFVSGYYPIDWTVPRGTSLLKNGKHDRREACPHLCGPS